jgi:hypothetical protein
MPRITCLVVTGLVLAWPGFFTGCTVHVDEPADRPKVNVEVERPKPNVDVDVDVKRKP